MIHELKPVAQPLVGQSYTDPTFGLSIRRLTDARNSPDNASEGGRLPWIAPEYSSICPFNCDNSRLLLVHSSYFGLYDGEGRYVVDLPFQINASAEPRWSRTDPDLLYFIEGNWLRSYDVARRVVLDIRQFPYQAIRGKGKSDLSEDGDHLVLCGGDANVFLYQISANKKYNPRHIPNLGNIYVTPDNNVLVTIFGSVGMLLFDRDMALLRGIANSDGHMDLTRDADGAECAIWANSADPFPPITCPNGVVRIRLADAHQTCLLQLPWTEAIHISCGDGKYAFVSTYQTPESSWVEYSGEIIQVPIDGSEVKRIAHHRSNVTDYTAQPHASVSRDGTRIVWASNFGTEHVDTYMAVLQEPEPGKPAVDELPDIIARLDDDVGRLKDFARKRK